MLKVTTHAVGVEQGDVLFSHYEEGGSLWRGEGRREARTEVRFSQPFAKVPLVQVAISMWDIADGANSRVDAKAEEVGPEGFSLVLRTWGDTRVARARVGWLAIGTVPDPEVWDLD
jgi:hypothetical protein